MSTPAFRLVVVCACSAAALVGASSAFATPAWLAPVDLSAAGQNAAAPQVAIDGAGDVTAIWDRSDGSNSIVQAAVRPAGGGFSAPVDLSAAGRDADLEQVAVDGAGDAVAVWRRFDGSKYIVQAAVRPAGGSFGAPVDLSAAGQNADAPQVALDPAGNAVAVWDRYDSAGHTIAQAAVRPAGGSFGMPVDLSAAGNHAQGAQVAVDQAGDAIAVWRRYNGTKWIAQAAVRPAGGSFAMPVDLSLSDLDASLPQVAVDAAGDAVVVWDHFDTFNGNNSTVQATVRPAGGAFGAPVDLSKAGIKAYGSHVAMDPAGDAVAVWERSDGDFVVQAAARPAGGSFGAVQDVSVSTGVPSARVAMDPAGDAIAVWQGYTDPVLRTAACTDRKSVV